MGWTLHVAAPAMLWGLVGVSIPVLIHLLSRRRATTIDWGAMQFLDLGRRARRKFRITELLLMAGRMALLGLVALAVARPFLAPKGGGSGAAEAAGGGSADEPRDVVLILDGSESTARVAGGTTARARAIAWARSFVKDLPAGSGVAVLDARDRVRPIVEPPSFDKAKVDAALADAPPPRGSSDLPAAVGEAFRILEGTKNTAKDVILLTDGQRLAWRPGDTARWDLLRDLHKEMKARKSIAPGLWALTFAPTAEPEGADGAVGTPELARGLVPAGLPITVSATLSNAGPGSLSRDAELLVDGVPVPDSRRPVGPIPKGGKTTLEFRATIAVPGSHLLTVRLDPGDDPLATNDEASRPVEVAEALPVLLVDGEPGGAEPLSGEVDFLRAALAPSDDATPAVRATVVRPDDFTAERLKGQRVLVLANVESLDAGRSAAVADFLANGGGVLVAPGDQVDPRSYNDRLYRDGDGWLPAELGELKGSPRGREPAAHPDPPTFNGPSLAPFGRGEAPPLGRATLFAYRVIEPASQPPAAVVARLDTGDPWLVERPAGRGRVALLSAPLDAEGGTLPVNPDFVPLVHTLVFHLADPSASAEPLRPGGSIRLDLADAPGSLRAVPVRLPDGREARAEVLRDGGRAQVRFEGTTDPGVYRVETPDAPAYVLVESDDRESEPARLEPAEAEHLAKGWPLAFEDDPDGLSGRLLAQGRGGPRPFWRWLVLAALAGLCLEVVATRRIARVRGLTARDEA
jgi:hypothetical protein